MTTRTSYYGAKFDSAQDEVVYNKSLDFSYVDDTIGDVHEYGAHHSRIDGLYGRDWIIHEYENGSVEVESFQAAEPVRVTQSSECDQRWLKLQENYEQFLADQEGEYDGQ